MDMDGHAAREAAAAHILAKALRARGGKASVESDTCNCYLEKRPLEEWTKFSRGLYGLSTQFGPPIPGRRAWSGGWGAIRYARRQPLMTT